MRLTLTFVLLGSLSLVAAERKPNILVIVGDDMGYADVGFHGCKDIPTPHIDALAKTGVRCTNGYVSGPYCRPTRAGPADRPLPDSASATSSIPAARPRTSACRSTETTLADRLKAAGYATGLVGKWHLGDAPKHPSAASAASTSSSASSAARTPTSRARASHPPRHGAGRREGVPDRRLRPRGGRVHRPAQGEAVLPLPGVQRRAHADAGDRRAAEAVRRRSRTSSAAPTPR